MTVRKGSGRCAAALRGAESALVWLAGRIQTATSSILLARAVEAARTSRNSPRDRVVAYCPQQQGVLPDEVPGAGDRPAGDQVGHRDQVAVDGQFSCLAAALSASSS